MTATDYDRRGLPRLKEWVMDEAQRCQVGVTAIYMRLHRGRYPNVKKLRVNQRVVYVREGKA